MQNKQSIPVFQVLLALFLLTGTCSLVAQDSIPVRKTRVSKDAVTSPVTYMASDSISFELENQHIFLYDSGSVDYEDISLKADYIELDLKRNEVSANGVDSAGKVVGKPEFSNDGQTFKSDSMRYNFDSKKGKIKNVVTQEGEGYLHGETVKRDSSNTFFIKNGKYTTCDDLEHPHFYIKASKLKVIPNDKIISGPAYLMIADIPTPLAVPFGFFPTEQKRSSGIIIPTYGESNNIGFFLKNGGYYFGISDYMDLTLTADIYSRGSWGGHANSNYVKRYKYDGDVSFDYSYIKISEKLFPDYSLNKTFFVRWNHRQNTKARPGTSFSADVNAGSSKYNKFNSISSGNYLANTFRSSINYSKSWKKANLSVDALHNQNTQTQEFDFTLPNVFFSMNTANPFQRKVRTGPVRWYENISIGYSANLSNRITAKESELSKIENPDTLSYLLQKMKNGMQQQIPVSTTIKMFKFFTLSPRVNYTETWLLQTVQKDFYTAAEANDVFGNFVLNDTTVTTVKRGFTTSRDYVFTAPLTTKIYGMYQFKGKNLKAMQHVMTPSVGYRYVPGLGKMDSVMTSSGKKAAYSPYEGAIFSTANPMESSNIDFSLANSLEIKVRNKKDTVNLTKKVKIFDNFNFGSSYNMMADSMNFAPLTVNANTQISQHINVLYNGVLNPYALDPISGRTTKAFEWDVNNNMGRLTNSRLAVNLSLKNKSNNQMYATKKKSKTEVAKDAYYEFSIPWNASVAYIIQNSREAYVSTITHTININSEIRPTSKWRLNVSTNYDLKLQKISYTTINVYRDLHCWEMSLSLVPFGFAKSYNFSINVKASTLQELKLNRSRSWQDLR